MKKILVAFFCFSLLAFAKVGKKNMVIKTQYGNIEIEFFEKDAPKTVEHIKKLVTKGFYNGLTFHRVIPGFVAQGGDPLGNGTGGSGTKIKEEFTKNPNKHVEGTVAMARSADPNSADSQFYISLATLPDLDNKYTIFGKVTQGMDAVKKLKIGDKMLEVTLK